MGAGSLEKALGWDRRSQMRSKGTYGRNNRPRGRKKHTKRLETCKGKGAGKKRKNGSKKESVRRRKRLKTFWKKR